MVRFQGDIECFQEVAPLSDEGWWEHHPPWWWWWWRWTSSCHPRLDELEKKVFCVMILRLMYVKLLFLFFLVLFPSVFAKSITVTSATHVGLLSHNLRCHFHLFIKHFTTILKVDELNKRGKMKSPDGLRAVLTDAEHGNSNYTLPLFINSCLSALMLFYLDSG